MAVDTLGQMSLTIDDPEGMPDALVGPAVFAVDADDRRLVMKQHPRTDSSGGFDRSLANYYVIDRSDSVNPADLQKPERGPLS
jgi:hypothetical protein